MGWVYTQNAGRTLDAIEAACQATRPEGEASSNVFYAHGKRYFYEVCCRDQQDRGIAGTIFWCVSEEMCRAVGRFRIGGNGNVLQGPALFKNAKPVSNGKYGS